MSVWPYVRLKHRLGSRFLLFLVHLLGWLQALLLGWLPALLLGSLAGLLAQHHHLVIQ